MNIGRYENSNVDVKIKSIVATILGDGLFEDITRICERYSEEQKEATSALFIRNSIT